MRIPRTVVFLGLVSFFNDLASEMIYPIVPIFLTAVLHTSLPALGLIEGVAESTASLSKYGFGTFSDYVRRRKVFVLWGYGLGAFSKLLIGLASSWPFVLTARFVDRVGKGVRTAARDSLLLENTTPETRGRIFGFHRAFDSLGAVFGPLIGLLLLFLLHDNMRLTFFIAFIPAVIAAVVLFACVHEKPRAILSAPKHRVKIGWRTLNPSLRLFLIVNVLFALGNSSDAFIILRGQSLGFTTSLVVCTYVLYNVSQTLFATPAGIVADKIGAKKVYGAGLVIFALVYAGFGFAHEAWWLWILFPVYGMYIAFTDGVGKAYISEFVVPEESGTYFGLHYTLTAFGTLAASVFGGLLWASFGPSVTFLYGSVMAIVACVVFCIGSLATRQKP